MKRLEKLAQKTIGSSAGELSFSESRGALNGLILVAHGDSYVNGDKCNITYVPKDGKPQPLVTNVPLKHLQMLSELHYGAPVTDQANTILANASANQASINVYAIYIDLGHVQLEGGHKLEVSFEFAQADRSDFKVKCYSVYANTTANIMKSYYETTQLNHSVDKVRFAYLISTATNGFDNGSGTVQSLDASIIRNGEQSNTDLYGLLAYTALFSDVEIALTDGIALFAKEDHGLPMSLSWNFTGTTTDVVSLIVSDVVIPELVSKGSESQIAKNLQKTLEFELSSPEEAKAYRHAGISIKSDRIAKVLEHIRKQ